MDSLTEEFASGGAAPRRGSRHRTSAASSARGSSDASPFRGISPGGVDGPTPGSSADDSPPADPVAVARAICLRQLTLGPRTRAQLADALLRRGVPDDVGAQVLDRFTEVGLIDDAAFAAMWVETRHNGRGLARRALAHELRTRGVADPLVAEAVEGLDGDRERATARALVDRKLASTRGLPAEVRVRRLAGMLARKGYPGGLAFAVVRDALAQESSGADCRPADPDSRGPNGEELDDLTAALIVDEDEPLSRS